MLIDARRKHGLFHGKNCVLLLGDNPIKPYIPSIWRNFLDFLAAECNADKLRSKPVFSVSQKRETAIEEAGAHADAMTVIVEGDRRCDDEIEIFGCNDSPARRLPDAESILFQFGIRVDLAKQHLRTAAQNRHKNALVCAPRALNDFA